MSREDVWVKVMKNAELECQFLMGDLELFDQVQCIFEDEMSTIPSRTLIE